MARTYYDPARRVDSIKPPETEYPDNRILALLCKNMREDGKSIVPMVIYETGEIRKGFGRYAAAVKVGLETVPCFVIAEGEDEDGNYD